MKVLIGTTNPSKVKRFKGLISGRDIEFLTLNDFCTVTEPLETGRTPLENAEIKAKFYSRYCDRVICDDSALYFKELDISDPRQPGLQVRSPEGIRLNDRQIIDYYGRLIESLGGMVTACYHDGIAVYNCGKIFRYETGEESLNVRSFYMVSKPSEKIHEGWPLDSLSLNRRTLKYFTDETESCYADDENAVLCRDREELIEFLINALQ